MALIIWLDAGGNELNVSLTPQLENFVRQKVESGLYGSASEVVREALRLLAERDRHLDALRQDIRDGLVSGSSAPLDIEAIKAEGRRRLGQGQPIAD